LNWLFLPLVQQSGPTVAKENQLSVGKHGSRSMSKLNLSQIGNAKS